MVNSQTLNTNPNDHVDLPHTSTSHASGSASGSRTGNDNRDASTEPIDRKPRIFEGNLFHVSIGLPRDYEMKMRSDIEDHGGTLTSSPFKSDYIIYNPPQFLHPWFKDLRARQKVQDEHNAGRKARRAERLRARGKGKGKRRGRARDGDGEKGMDVGGNEEEEQEEQEGEGEDNEDEDEDSDSDSDSDIPNVPVTRPYHWVYACIHHLPYPKLVEPTEYIRTPLFRQAQAQAPGSVPTTPSSGAGVSGGKSGRPSQQQMHHPLRIYLSVNMPQTSLLFPDLTPPSPTSPETPLPGPTLIRLLSAFIESHGAFHSKTRKDADVLILNPQTSAGRRFAEEVERAGRGQRVEEREWVERVVRGGKEFVRPVPVLAGDGGGTSVAGSGVGEGSRRKEGGKKRRRREGEDDGSDSFAEPLAPVKAPKKGRRRAGRVEYTEKDEDNIARWLFVYHPQGNGWQTLKSYEELCSPASLKFFPWADRHTPQSWHERVKKHLARYKILSNNYNGRGLDGLLRTKLERRAKGLDVVEVKSRLYSAGRGVVRASNFGVRLEDEEEVGEEEREGSEEDVDMDRDREERNPGPARAAIAAKAKVLADKARALAAAPRPAAARTPQRQVQQQPRARARAQREVSPEAERTADWVRNISRSQEEEDEDEDEEEQMRVRQREKERERERERDQDRERRRRQEVEDRRILMSQGRGNAKKRARSPSWEVEVPVQERVQRKKPRLAAQPAEEEIDELDEPSYEPLAPITPATEQHQDTRPAPAAAAARDRGRIEISPEPEAEPEEPAAGASRDQAEVNGGDVSFHTAREDETVGNPSHRTAEAEAEQDQVNVEQEQEAQMQAQEESEIDESDASVHNIFDKMAINRRKNGARITQTGPEQIPAPAQANAHANAIAEEQEEEEVEMSMSQMARTQPHSGNVYVTNFMADIGRLSTGGVGARTSAEEAGQAVAGPSRQNGDQTRDNGRHGQQSGTDRQTAAILTRAAPNAHTTTTPARRPVPLRPTGSAISMASSSRRTVKKTIGKAESYRRVVELSEQYDIDYNTIAKVVKEVLDTQGTGTINWALLHEVLGRAKERGWVGYR